MIPLFLAGSVTGAHAYAETISHCGKQAGCNKHLTKPIKIEEMKYVLANYIKQA